MQKKRFNTKNITKWLRIIHRDLGFLMVGICLVYGISGFLLNHIKSGDAAYKTEQGSLIIEKNLNKELLQKAWEKEENLPPAKKIFSAGEDKFQITFEGGMGSYIPSSGNVEYQKSTKRPFVYWINKLHYNQVKNWNVMADIFAVSLIFFAVSGLFMVKGKKGLKGRGKWYLFVGILIPVVYIILS